MATKGGLFAAKTWANLSQIRLLPGLLRKVKRISNDENKNESSPAHTEDYYEAAASQEQTYLVK